jgi:AmmeMemoRadiSam system protein B
MIREYIDEATLPKDLGTVRAIIAPHAGYIYSGRTAGYAFKALEALPDKEWTVFLLGPAHRARFLGVALGDYSAFRTPLGDVPIAVDRVVDLLARSPLYTRTPKAHEHEHCLEVEVPFLQTTLASFCLVPMLFSDVDPEEVAIDLADHIDEDDLIVISNDLSHFHPYDEAQRRDQRLLDALLINDTESVLRGEACGQTPVATLMGIAGRKKWTPRLLDYRTSGDTAGDKWQVVGYASVAYTD